MAEYKRLNSGAYLHASMNLIDSVPVSLVSSGDLR